LEIKGYRIDRTGAKLEEEPTPNGYLNLYFSWYQPGRAREIEEFKRIGGRRSASTELTCSALRNSLRQNANRKVPAGTYSSR
jgi:hypothetical protein